MVLDTLTVISAFYLEVIFVPLQTQELLEQAVFVLLHSIAVNVHRYLLHWLNVVLLLKLIPLKALILLLSQAPNHAPKQEVQLMSLDLMLLQSQLHLLSPEPQEPIAQPQLEPLQQYLDHTLGHQQLQVPLFKLQVLLLSQHYPHQPLHPQEPSLRPFTSFQELQLHQLVQ